MRRVPQKLTNKQFAAWLDQNYEGPLEIRVRCQHCGHKMAFLVTGPWKPLFNREKPLGKP